MLSDPAFRHLYFDISWDEVAKYMAASDSMRSAAALFEKYPDRFLFGTDAVGPVKSSAWLKTYNLYAPLWAALSPATSAKIRLENYERLFDEARRRVRGWERAHPK